MNKNKDLPEEEQLYPDILSAAGFALFTFGLLLSSWMMMQGL